MTARTVVSAPGKVLMAGGYLVLDRMYKGLVIGADARFYTLIQSVEPTAASGPITITVESPQFKDALWTYHATWSDEHSTYTLSNVGPTKNPFVAITINYTLNLAAYRLRDHDFPRRLGGGLKLVILGDNDFYSQQDKLKEQGRVCSTAALSSLPRFSAFPFPLHQVHKTGLGSSAALVTSMVCALMMHLGVDQISQAYPGSTVDSMTSPAFLRWVHHISQYCHCLAQGKIGSGFDVSAAVYGSHIYRRFSPSILEPIIPDEEMADNAPIIDIKLFCDTLCYSNPSWDNAIVPISLPPRFRLMLADVDSGSHTPSMVKKVLQWRKSSSCLAKNLFDRLQHHNKELITTMELLGKSAELNPTAYNQAVAHCRTVRAIHICDSLLSHPEVTLAPAATIDPAQYTKAMKDVAAAISHMAETFLTIRGLLRELGTKTDVPIEPPQQTELLDRCMEIPGVVMAGVPGAGGYDAIFCVVLSEDIREQVEQLWLTGGQSNVSPLLARESSKGLQLGNPDDSVFAPYF